MREKGTEKPKGVSWDDGGWPAEVVDWRAAVPNVLLGLILTFAFVMPLAGFLELPPEEREFAAHRNFVNVKLALFVLTYILFLVFSRWAESDAHVVYEVLWACNVGMLLLVVGLLTNKPLLAGCAASLVAVDQLCWYLEVLLFLVTGCRKCRIGVAGYMIWPNTPLMKKVTAFHHLWFLPLILYCLGGRIPQYSFLVGCVLGCVLTAISRALTPFQSRLAGHSHTKEDGGAGHDHRVVYMNINASYAFWKDVKFRFLHALDHRSPLVFLPYLWLCGNLVLNLPANLLLNSLCERVLEPLALRAHADVSA